MELFHHVGVINQDNKMIQMSDKFKQRTKSVAAAPAARISWRLCLTVSYLEPLKRGFNLKQIADLIIRIEKAIVGPATASEKKKFYKLDL